MHFKYKNITFSVGLLLLISTLGFSQSFKEKMKAKFKKDKSEIYECGYIYKPTLKDKLNPMKALQKSLGGAATSGNNPDIGSAAISVFYQAHLHPQSIVKYPTKTPGWQTCGDAVFLGFTNKDGAGLSSTDGQVTMRNVDAGETTLEIPFGGIGTYFQGFSDSDRSEKLVTITSSNGKSATVNISPGAPLEIKSVNGVPRGGEITIDGTEDVTIVLENGNADPQSKLHVQLVCKLVGTPIIYDILVTTARNTIVIPKEAFKNFEGSPSPMAKVNTLMVNRVTEKIYNDTEAGALRTISAYMDWMPISVGGDLSKGNALTMGFDSTKNVNIKIDMTTEGEYNFIVSKDGPYLSPPVKLMKKAAIASFIIKGKLDATTTTSYNGWINRSNKWFPEMADDTWQKLADKMYAQFESAISENMGVDIVSLRQVTQSEAYRHAKDIEEGASRTFVEVGAGNTKRILTTSFRDLQKDLGITFPGDFVSERLINELGVDVVFAVTVDLNFNFQSEGLDPKVSIEAFAPNVSYKTAAKYFSISAATTAKSLDDSRKYTGGVENVLYQMIKADTFNKEFINALKALSAQEDQYPVYEKLWSAKM
ncbi:MAG: hypothetical protein AAFO69_01080 [Bacteroidota bacterium]